MDCNIDYLYSTPPYKKIEKESWTRRKWNRILGFIYSLFGYVIAEPIVICRGRVKTKGYGRNIILLRGGNLERFTGRRHCRARQKQYPTHTGKKVIHSGYWCWKLAGIEEYGDKKAVMLGKHLENVFY